MTTLWMRTLAVWLGLTCLATAPLPAKPVRVSGDSIVPA